MLELEFRAIRVAARITMSREVSGQGFSCDANHEIDAGFQPLRDVFQSLSFPPAAKADYS
jgi:hypothetical protein